MSKSKKQTDFQIIDKLAPNYKKLTDQQLIDFVKSAPATAPKKYRIAVKNEIKRRGLRIE